MTRHDPPPDDCATEPENLNLDRARAILHRHGEHPLLCIRYLAAAAYSSGCDEEV